MSSRKQHRVGQSRQIWQLPNTGYKQQMLWLLRCLMLDNKNSHLSNSGFVLPTVAMVMLVVVLVTTALVLRAFDRSRYASNVRVDAAVANAAKPGIDRARAKIEALLSDPTLPRDTPSDTDFYNALTSSRYVLGDENRLKLIYDINNDKIIQKRPTVTSLEKDEATSTAWKFPVDTDNNGKFDSYTLYSIVFRSPNRGLDGRFEQSRNPLEARTPPMKGALSRRCEIAAGTNPNLVGDSSWYKSGSNLTKSFFAYTATVPIDTPPTSPTVGSVNDYEPYRGNRGFSALEFQQDRSRVPLNSNTVLFQNDLELTPGVDFRMNGKMFTNANLLIGGHNSKAIRLYQISSKNSCFYKEQNSKITVGGNVGTGNVADDRNQTAVTVDLFRGIGNDPSTATIDGDNKSTSEVGGKKVGYNDAAYSKRIASMKEAMLAFSTTNPPTVATINTIPQYPLPVKAAFKAKIEAPGGNSLNAQEVLAEQIEIYLKDRTRRVPFAEVAAADGTNAILIADGNGIDTSSGSAEPIAKWREPTDTNTGLSLSATNLQQTQPEKQREDGTESYLGDRINVGNNLPAYWKNLTKYVTGPFEKQFLGNAIKWTNPNNQERYRTTQVVALPDVGIANRDGFWEDAASQKPATRLSSIGGLRVITGAGIYRNSASTYTVFSVPSFLPLPTTLDGGQVIPNAPLLAGENTPTPYTLVWSDTMPMSGGIDNLKTLINESTAPADLRMRATAIYHYANNAGTSQTPIACVSSYYDPTSATTARNNVNVDGGYGVDTINGRSNNGVVYPTPYTSNAGRFSAIAIYLTELKAQAKLMFPNGRIVNQPLQQALFKLNGSGGLLDNTRPLSLSENSAIDTAICGIKILTDSSFTPTTDPIVPHGAIREATFLDAREVQAIHKPAITTDYNLELEKRQPLEVRVTDIDLSQLATKKIGSANAQEYLLPNSGIIYASRDDALLDLSDTTSGEAELLSPTDFKLDPTRRPNGIRLIEGSNLKREDDYREEEKGLILVTNLPAYIKGNFNLHQQPNGTPTEEFTDTLEYNWSDFYDRNPTLDANFACRKGQSGCGGNGDFWRPATIISDAMTLQSGSFRDGFRNQGDYDLNNNAGTTVTPLRQKNGFWDNSFVPSALWWDTGNTDNAYPNEKTDDSYVGSYLTNAVTPIQRRVSAPEYVMEICRKVPLSECKPSDWVVGYDNNGDGDIDDTGESDVKSTVLPQNANVTRLGAGTTALPALKVEDRRYARRIAFKRSTGNTLELTNWSKPNEDNVTPIPWGIDTSGQVVEFPYTNNALPRIGNNALWFRTTTNTVGEPYNNPSYANNRPLAYTRDTKFTSPFTPEIDNVRSLNLPSDNRASSYTVCTTNSGSSQKPLVDNSTILDKTACNNDAIDQTLQGLLALDPSASDTDAIVTPDPSGNFVSGGETTFTQKGPVNVIDLGGGAQTLGTSATKATTIKLVGDEDSIFVFQKKSGSLKFAEESNCSSPCVRKGVVIELDGVDPNKVFWALDANTQWNEVDPRSPHKMKGTFISKGAAPKLKNVEIEGRLLGVNGLPSSPNFVASSIKAIASTDQPLLVPVLQIHTPEGTPSTGTNLSISGNIVNRWLQNVAANTTVNAVFVAGNSPSRPEESDIAGLHNFVRFQENWAEKPLNIQGSFIQLKRSTYATAPFANVLAAKKSSNDGSLSIFGYSSTPYNGNPIPYYNPPTRQWGFDVGLLSQSPDLFAQKFTLPSVAAPNEFFRQVGRDDLWIKTLLCAAQGSNNNYIYAVDQNERGSCAFAPSAYND